MQTVMSSGKQDVGVAILAQRIEDLMRSMEVFQQVERHSNDDTQVILTAHMRSVAEGYDITIRREQPTPETEAINQLIRDDKICSAACKHAPCARARRDVRREFRRREQAADLQND